MAISVFNKSIENKSGGFMLTWNALVVAKKEEDYFESRGVLWK